MTPQKTWPSPNGAKYPAKWRIEIPRERISLTIEPQMASQELTTQTAGVTYWEGAVRVAGTSSGRAIAGKGYVELTGYNGTVGGKF